MNLQTMLDISREMMARRKWRARWCEAWMIQVAKSQSLNRVLDDNALRFVIHWTW